MAIYNGSVQWFEGQSQLAAIRTILFDMDNTLYDNPGYAEHQERVLVQALARELGRGYQDMQQDLDGYRQKLEQETGARPSLGNSFLHFGVSIETSVEWRNRYIKPEQYLQPDAELAGSLEKLGRRFTLFVVTNNPSALAGRTLSSLGIATYFSGLQGLDDSGISKPDPKIFMQAARRAGTLTQHCLSVGDRYAVDIAPALELGMWGLLIDSVAEVYALDNLLPANKGIRS